MAKEYDVIVIGGGPSGMMAAGSAGANGRKVLLLEKNPSLGKKLLITGGGRSNITNANLDLRKAYKIAGKYLATTFAQYGVEQSLQFFHGQGMETKVEAEGRVFPKSDRSQSVLDALKQYLQDGKVQVRCSSEVTKIQKKDDVFNIKLKTGETLLSKSCIIATGGISRPETGSTGEGFKWLAELGHNIIDNDLALVPVKVREPWVKDIAGLAMQDVKIYLYCDGHREDAKPGKVLFTHVGLSGPTILNMSKQISDLLQAGKVTLEIDMFPKKDHGLLRNELNDLLQRESNKMIKNTLKEIVPSSLAPLLLRLTEIDPDTFNHSVRKDQRMALVHLIKKFTLEITSLLGSDKAIISSGGVDIDQIDFRKMESKIVPGLHIVGDLINIDRPSGGYSLQLCWSCGFVAGVHAGE